MKKIYEKDQLLIFTSFFFIVIELFCFINLCFKNFRTFEMIQGVVVSDNYFKSYVDSKTIKKLTLNLSLMSEFSIIMSL